MKFMILFVVCLMVAGCSSNSVQDFRRNSNSVAYQLDKVSKLPGVLLKDKPIKGELNGEDPIVVIDGQRTAFDLYKFESESGAHMLTIKTYCDCFGFSKEILVPEVRVVNRNGKFIEASLMNQRRVQPLLGAFYFEFTWVFDTLAADAVKILIGSDNRKLGEVAATVKGTGAFTTQSSGHSHHHVLTIEGIEVTSAPYGNYEIFIE